MYYFGEDFREELVDFRDERLELVDFLDERLELVDFLDERLDDDDDFGDGSGSSDQNPVHFYSKPGYYVVTLSINGPAGNSALSKVWDVAVK